jgi:SAM-dependent methyltransferase
LEVVFDNNNQDKYRELIEPLRAEPTHNMPERTQSFVLVVACLGAFAAGTFLGGMAWGAPDSRGSVEQEARTVPEPKQCLRNEVPQAEASPLAKPSSAPDEGQRPIQFLSGDVVMRQIWRDGALELLSAAKQRGESILDFGGATVGHMRYATTVADYHDHSAWYSQNAPSVRFVPGADVAKPLPFSDGEFDWVWTSHVAEHVPDPVLFCNEMNRIARVGGVLCVPTPLSDNLVSPKHGKPGSLDHVWWWFAHPTDPNKLAYMPVIRVLNYMKGAQQKNNLMRTWFGNSWENCFVFRKPLQCEQIPQEMADWGASQNVLPLKKAGPPAQGINLA